MLRNILAVIVGYVVIFLITVISFSAAYMALGAAGSFKPGSYDVSSTWAAISIIVGLASAMLGGAICARIAASAAASKVFAGIVFLLGLLLAIPTLSAEEAPARESDEIPMSQAMRDARQPTWFALLNPLLGAGGILLGARLVSTSTKKGESVV